MEIIKHGTPPGDVEYEATCSQCKTEIRFKRSEATYVPDQRDGNYLTVPCPVCYASIHKAVK